MIMIMIICMDANATTSTTTNNNNNHHHNHDNHDNNDNDDNSNNNNDDNDDTSTKEGAPRDLARLHRPFRRAPEKRDRPSNVE